MSLRGRKIICILTTAILAVFLFINPVFARRGCCSWHGGVCTYTCPDGVNLGYYCCDGSPLSAKCAPYYPKCPTKSTPTSTPQPKPSPTPSPLPTSTPTPLPTPTPIPTQIPTNTPTPTSTPKPSSTPTLSPTFALSPSPTPSPEVLGEKTAPSGIGWLAFILLLPMAVGSFLLIKGRKK